jgi:hypothetical protein
MQFYGHSRVPMSRPNVFMFAIKVFMFETKDFMPAAKDFMFDAKVFMSVTKDQMSVTKVYSFAANTFNFDPNMNLLSQKNIVLRQTKSFSSGSVVFCVRQFHSGTKPCIFETIQFMFAHRPEKKIRHAPKNRL